MPINEQALADAIEQDSPKQEENLEVESKQEEQQEKVQLSALELEAQKMGHTSKDDFIAKGGDAERYKSAHEYVAYGKLQERNNKTNAKMDAMEERFNKRLEGVNKIHEQQLKAKTEELKAEQRSSVEDGDTERYDAAQKKIDDISKQESEAPLDDKPPTSDKAPEIVAWEEKNPWINDVNDPKAQMTAGLWNGFVKANPTATAKTALEYVDKQLEAMNPPEHNQRRDNVNTTERGNQTPKTASKVSSIQQLSPELQKAYNQTIDIWGDNDAGRKAFIQAAKDSEKKQ